MDQNDGVLVMALAASGQWLVDAGMRMMDRKDQAAWRKWTRDDGWSPADRDPKHLPGPIAELAVRALDELVSSLNADLKAGHLSDSEELDAINDLDSAQAVRSGVLEDVITQHPRPRAAK